MKKVYFLSTCSTCHRILSQLNIPHFEKQDIKNQPITPGQLDEMQALSGSYGALFSRRSMKYKSLGLKDRNLKENDFKQYILSEYTFLKRPVFIIDDQIFIGSSPRALETLKKAIDATS